MSELQAQAGCSKQCLNSDVERCANGWPDGSCGARPQGTQWPKDARAKQEPQWDNNETLKRYGKSYEFRPNSDDKPEVVWLYDGRMDDYCRTVYYLFELKGAHVGEPFRVRMVNPHTEFNTEGGVSYEWSMLIHDHDQNRVEDIIEDYYSEALSDELKEIVRETWD